MHKKGLAKGIACYGLMLGGVIALLHAIPGEQIVLGMILGGITGIVGAHVTMLWGEVL